MQEMQVNNKAYRVAWTAALLFILFFSLYLKTAANQPFSGDCSELTAASYVLGIPHTTGYSTYCLLNRIAAQTLPIGNIAFRSSITSAIFASLALVFLFLYLSKIFSLPSAFWGSSLLGLSLIFWSQANIQEVYSLHMFFLCLLLFLAEKSASRFSLSILYLLFFFMGLSLTNHGLSIFSFPALLLYIWPGKSLLKNYAVKWKPIVAGMGFFILGLSVLFYFPVRALTNCVILWRKCNIYSEFINHVSGRLFKNLMFNQSFIDTWKRFLLYKQITQRQFPIIFFAVALYGVYVLFKRKRKLAYVFILFFVLVNFFTLQYRIVDIEVYFIQSYLSIIVFIVAGLDDLRQRLLSRSMTIFGLSWLIILFGSLAYMMVKNYRQNDFSRNYVAYDWGINAYNSAPPNSMLITQGWNSPFMFFYLDHVLDYRPDLLMLVDYKGSTFHQASNQNWDIPVVSTLPVEIPGIDEEEFKIYGVVYQFVKPNKQLGSFDTYKSIIRKRSLWDPKVDLDFHCLAIKANYVIIEGFWKLETGDRAEAEKYFQRSEAISIFNPLVFNNLSCIYFKLGDYKKAEEKALMALDLDPSLIPALHNLGNALLKQKRYSEAIEIFEKVKGNIVSLGRQREALGFLYLIENECEKAMSEFKKALIVSPSSQSAAINLGISQYRCGYVQEALITFNDLVEKGNSSIEAYLNRANAFIAIADFQSAGRDLAIVLSLQPERFEARLAQSVVLFEEGDEVEAVRKLHELASEFPESTAVLNNLGLMAFRQQNYDQAIEYWEKSIELDSGQLDIHRYLWEIQFERYFLND